MSGKTHKGIKKRFKTTATGKVIRQPAGRRHLMSTKSGRRSQHLRKPVVLDKHALEPLERQYGKLR